MITILFSSVTSVTLLTCLYLAIFSLNINQLESIKPSQLSI